MSKQFTVEQLQITIYKDAEQMGAAAADLVEKKLSKAIESQGEAHLMLATGTSQFTFLEALKQRDIEWDKVVVFHLDEYLGLAEDHPASFRRYLKDRILDEVKPQEVYFLNGSAQDVEGEIARYETALKAHHIDIGCIGIGENGHIAFNDPPVADFNDPRMVKVVELDEKCRNQQLGEGWFPTLEAVPEKALTLTIPAIMDFKAISCVVPDERKAEAVYNTLYGPVSTKCPAAILRRHPQALMFLDEGSASKL